MVQILSTLEEQTYNVKMSIVGIFLWTHDMDFNPKKQLEQQRDAYSVAQSHIQVKQVY